jgi:hypothetical protein
LQDETARYRLHAAVAGRQKSGARRDADQRGHRGAVTPSGGQACPTLGAAGPQDAATTDGGHTRTETVPALADENTGLIGAFHGDAPFARSTGCQKLLAF